MLGSPVIRTEHLLLGVLKEHDPLITELLGAANVTAHALQQIVYARGRTRGTPLDESVEIPFSKDARPSANVLQRGTGFASLRTVSLSTYAYRQPDCRIHSIGPIAVSGITVAQFAVMLEECLEAALIVEDSARHGLFDIELTGEYHNEDARIVALRAQLGLQLTNGL